MASSHKCSFKVEEVDLSQVEPYISPRLQLHYGLAFFTNSLLCRELCYLLNKLCAWFTLNSLSGIFNHGLRQDTSSWSLAIQSGGQGCGTQQLWTNKTTVLLWPPYALPQAVVGWEASPPLLLGWSPSLSLIIVHFQGFLGLNEKHLASSKYSINARSPQTSLP